MSFQTNLQCHYNPQYIIDQTPNKFGGKQQDYLTRSQQIIDNTAEKISEALKREENIQNLFFEIIADLSTQRAKIAKDHNSENAEEFGTRRERKPGMVSFISMKDNYEKYGKKILQFFATHLRKMELSNGQFQKEMTIKSKWNDRQTILTFKVLTNQDKSDQGYNVQTYSYYPNYISYNEMELIDEGKIILTEDKISELSGKFSRFKKENPENYTKTREISMYAELFNKFPSPVYYQLSPQVIRATFSKEESDRIIGNMKSLHVHVVLRTEINGKLFRITDYFTWMYEDYEWITNKNRDHHPVKKMLENSKVIILHQDIFLMEETLKEIAKIFEKIVTWNRPIQKLQELKETVGLMRYLASNNHRDIRGTSAEDEWLERSIYKALGIQFLQNQKDQSVDLEAFANPLLADFMKAYDQMTDLKLSKVCC